MNITLDAVEARVMGCLIEKERATPEYYPLTLNSLVSACNQKSNRDPVMHLDHAQVERALESLRLKGLVCLKHMAGSRTAKHAHRLLDFFQLSDQEIGVLCVLLLRGPQTAGELRSRTGRLCSFTEPGQIETVLQDLATREDGPFIVTLPRQPGQSAPRHAHLFCGRPEAAAVSAPPVETPASAAADGSTAGLEQRINELCEEVTALKQRLDRLEGTPPSVAGPAEPPAAAEPTAP